MSELSKATTAANEDALRGPAGIIGAGLLCVALSFVPTIPAVREVLRVGPLDVGVALGVFWLVMIAGAFVYRAGKDSKAYRVFDQVETAFVQLVVLSLAFRSGRGDSFFWLLAIVHMMVIGGIGTHYRYNYVVFSVMPVLLALAHLVTGNGGAAALSLVIGALGVYVYWVALTVSRKLAAADAERARLAAELADTRVREDRQRIARDIHDGVGADLAALDWRLRALRVDPSTSGEIDELLARLGQGSAELRTIVWALRSPSRSWRDVVAYLRQRSIELCGDAIELELVDEGDGGVAERRGEVALDFMRAVLEMVRNAVRHAGAKRLRIVLRSDAAGLGATVEDDGRGLPANIFERDEGGLANLRHRVARAGGELSATSPERGGTTLRVQLPAA